MFDNKVYDYLDLMKTPGDVGIEIEMETEEPMDRYTVSENLPLWRLEDDHSLKFNGTEFVLRKPCKYADVDERIAELNKEFALRDIHIRPSIRAGVHIHLNMQKQTVGDVFRLMACYYPMETVLTRFCGDGREGNLFCLRSRDAEYGLYLAEVAVAEENIYNMRTSNLRYSSMNLQSLFQYGSVEFRGLATVPDLSNIPVWVGILRKLKEYAIKNKCSWDCLSAISGDGPREWLRGVVGDEYLKLLEYPGMEQDMMDDVRNVQGLCYELKKKGL